jgi:peptidoglycan/xylan/chitin deacetylase (PgdA/CDA1 family)
MTIESQLTVCLTFDFDATSVWIAETDNPAAISRGEFGPYALPRILALLARYDITATFFIPGHTALAYPRSVCAIRDAGHEIGHHGWVHENPAPLGREGERRVIERGLSALETVAGVRPVGYRSPSSEFTLTTLNLLLEYGMLYEASCCGSDFLPYYLRSGDRWSKTEAYEFGSSVDLVEMPMSWALDDFPLMEFEVGWSTDQTPPSAVREIWQGEFDYAHAHVPGGVFVLTMHPQVIGRGSRLMMLDGLIDHMRGQPGVVFEPMHAYAQRWRAANPLEDWKRSDSVHVGHSASPQPVAAADATISKPRGTL